jgi:hypothetical protein
MGDSRTSNKDILNAVEAQTAAIDKLVNVLTATAVAAPQPKAESVPTSEPKATSVDVDAAYMAHMTAKAADHATAKGSEVVLYARRNRQGQVKLAYALKERYDSQIERQPSCIGPVGSFKP